MPLVSASLCVRIVVSFTFCTHCEMSNGASRIKCNFHTIVAIAFRSRFDGWWLRAPSLAPWNSRLMRKHQSVCKSALRRKQKRNPLHSTTEARVASITSRSDIQVLCCRALSEFTLNVSAAAGTGAAGAYGVNGTNWKSTLPALQLAL